MAEVPADFLSKRGQHTLNFPNFVTSMEEKLYGKVYDEQKNPEGIIHLGLADNKLCEDIVMAKLEESEMNRLEPDMLYYSQEPGNPCFREAVAKFMSERFPTLRPLKADNLIVTSGAGAGLDIMAHVLADPGDWFLCLAPYYTKIRTDVGERSMVQCWDIHVPTSVFQKQASHDDAIAKVQKSYEEALVQGKRVRAILLINPHNPTGSIYDVDFLLQILQFAKTHKLHVIMDEVYALSVYDTSATFTSVLNIPNLPDPQRTHVIWTFSKDFTLSGLRVGILHSWNASIIEAIKPLCSWATVPEIIQHKLKLLIEDKDWLENIYFPNYIQRTKSAYDYCKQSLEAIGVKVHPSKAGFFIWADFSKFLQPVTKENELKLFEKFLDGGVFISPGTTFYEKEAGWYRIIFTHKKEYVSKGLARITAVLKSLHFNI